MDSIIRLRNVHYAYDSHSADPIPALQGVDLTIHDGEFVTIVGHNGSGKSTLARHLNALLLPDRGEVSIKGWKTTDLSRLREIRSTVGMVFQNPDNQIVATIVEEDVAFGPENLGIPPGEIRERVDQSLEWTGLTELRHRAPHLLSGGQKQRVCIAGVLALRPQVLVLDEATAMLDPQGRRQVLDLVHRLNREHGITIVAITHHMEEAVAADRLVVMSQGKIALEGPPRKVFRERERMEQLGVEAPPISQLAGLLHDWDGRFPPDALSIDDFVTAVLRESRFQTRVPPRPVAAPARPKPEPGEPAIRVQDLEHYYLSGTPLETKALDGLSMEVGAGEIVGIMGATGSGKSTLVQHFNALLRPHRGQVEVLGQDTADPKADLRALRRRVGFVFQQPESQLFAHYVGDDVAYGPRNAGWSHREVRLRVQRAMQAVGLDFEKFKDRLTFALSGGQRRRVALAGVLALEPEILVLDEPTAGLDPAGCRQLMEHLLNFHRTAGTTLVLVSHDMEQLAQSCDRLVAVAAGRLALSGAPHAVFNQREELHRLGLGLPAVTEAMHRLREHGLFESDGPILELQQALAVLQEALA